MKQSIFIASLFLFLSGFTFKSISISDRLCKENEVIVYSFLLVKNGKVASLCKEKSGKYLVYRFGTKDNVELEYPGKLDASSWKAFTLNGAKRFGGKANAGFGDYRISFMNNTVKYELFESWSDEDGSKDTGIKITINGKETKVNGNYKSKEGTLLRLDDESDKIENKANDER